MLMESSLQPLQVCNTNPDGSISKDSGDWLQRAEEELHETPEGFKRELAALRRMVENDTNLTVPNYDQFLVRFLRARKFDSKKAFHMLQRYFLMKIRCPELFGCPLPSQCSHIFELQAQNMLPSRDRLGRRIFMMRVDLWADYVTMTIRDVHGLRHLGCWRSCEFQSDVRSIWNLAFMRSQMPGCSITPLKLSGGVNYILLRTSDADKLLLALLCIVELPALKELWVHMKTETSFKFIPAHELALLLDNFDSSKVTIEEIFRTNVLALEQIVREPETQIAGVVVVLDMAGLSLHHAKFFTPYYARKMVELVQETFPLRFKGFHIVNEPFYFDAVVAVLKPFLKEKIRKRIILHGSDITSLHAFIPSDILPSEYGGTAGCFDNRVWYMGLLAEEHYFKELETFGYKVDVEED